ncbi:MAG: hypothetical protein JXX29_21765 [Deltaproteobacteria bacterium]|nr:hypothetical protein [Deltaproteobacteria bacterium]MBN2674324.1 hypothetical protein [Deltaproteobacteria bacterium]
MNDEQKNTGQTGASTAGASGQQTSTIPAAGGLPGIGTRPAGGGLPGLGSRPPAGGLPGLGGGGGLPGLGGKPAGGGLPGLGAKPAGGGLPGMGAKPMGGLPGMGVGPSAAPGAAVPSFIQKQQEAERQKAMSRDPFSADVAPAAAPVSPSYVPNLEAAGPAFSDAEAGKSNKALYVIAAVLGLVFFGIGYGAGLAVNQRGMLNKVLRDAWIVQYEMQQLRALHGEVQGMVNTALADAQQKKFHKAHVAFLADKVSGNPFDARLFTDRNYKTLNPMVVQMMANLYNNWDKLATMVAEHRAATNNDEKALSTAGQEFQKLLMTNYGAIFSRDKNNNGALTANIVVLGAMNGESVQIQAKAGSYSDERKLYNPEGADDKLTTEPDQYVVPIGANSKKTILQNATQSHFEAYTSRLQEMAKLLKIMAEEQENMFGPLDDNCSREPVAPFTARGVDPELEFEEYKANKAKRGAAAAE